MPAGNCIFSESSSKTNSVHLRLEQSFYIEASKGGLLHTHRRDFQHMTEEPTDIDWCQVGAGWFNGAQNADFSDSRCSTPFSCTQP